MKPRGDILIDNPLGEFCQSRGIVLKPFGKELKGLCPLHNEKTPSFTVDPEKEVFHCFGCNKGGSVIDLMALMDGLTIGEAMQRLAGEKFEHPVPRPRMTTVTATPTPEGEEPLSTVDTIYPYRNAFGQEVYQVVRMNPKDFRQRHQENGKWVWNMKGVERVLYNLPSILKSNSQFVWIVEGEKDADNLKKCGFVATCNVGGAGKWLDGYSDCLTGKEIILCGDNDDAGRAHMGKVLNALAKIAKTVRRIEVPDPYKDVSDYIATFAGDMEAAAKSLFEMFESAAVLTGGVLVPVQTMVEMERDYVKFLNDAEKNTLELSRWIPSFGQHVRGIVPGEVVTFLAATGVGKTAALQNLAIHAAPMETLLFEMELPGTLTFERFVAISQKCAAWTVESTYKSAGQYPEWKQAGRLNHICVCSKSSLSPVEMEKIILQTELKTGVRPKVVLVDYHQLIQGAGKTRYERASDTSEQIKAIAKSTSTIIIVSSQVGRKGDNDGPEVFLNDGKDSGSVENSSGLVIGLWRDEADATLMHVKILKNTKGRSGAEIICNMDGPSLVITERVNVKIDQEDMPYRG